MCNKNKTTLYTGVTSNLLKRVYQHKTKAFNGFTSRYNCDQLAWYQSFSNITEAIAFEKKIKAGSRAAKEKIISHQNPEWNDLAEDWIFTVT